MRDVSFAVPVKLCAFACALTGVFLVQELIHTLLLAVLAFLYLIFQKNWRVAFSYGIFYLLLVLLLYLIRFHGFRMVIFSEFYVLMFFRLTPVFLVTWDLITTPPGELSAFLSRIHTPTPVILGLLVVFRFFPTMKSELRGIHQSMKNRGLTGAGTVLRHPGATCEYVLVPMLLRCLQVADQLAVSAVARGAERPGRRGSYSGKRTGISGGFWMGVWVIGTAGLLWFGGMA